MSRRASIDKSCSVAAAMRSDLLLARFGVARRENEDKTTGCFINIKSVEPQSRPRLYASVSNRNSDSMRYIMPGNLSSGTHER